MVRYYVVTDGSYIVAVGEGPGGSEIAYSEYCEIVELIRTCPKAPNGKVYKLKTDYTWELCDLPETPVDPETQEIAELVEANYESCLEIIGGE